MHRLQTFSFFAVEPATDKYSRRLLMIEARNGKNSKPVISNQNVCIIAERGR
jgi:hypothetical protein